MLLRTPGCWNVTFWSARRSDKLFVRCTQKGVYGTQKGIMLKRGIILKKGAVLKIEGMLLS